MKLIIKQELIENILSDLARPCEAAFERVGFLYGNLVNEGMLFDEYIPVDDTDYIKNEKYGAVFNKDAIKKVLVRILKSGKSCFQIHEHSSFSGARFSSIDLKTAIELNSTFHNFNPRVIHGNIVLCKDKMSVLYIDTNGEFQQYLGGWYE